MKKSAKLAVFLAIHQGSVCLFLARDNAHRRRVWNPSEKNPDCVLIEREHRWGRNTAHLVLMGNQISKMVGVEFHNELDMPAVECSCEGEGK